MGQSHQRCPKRDSLFRKMKNFASNNQSSQSETDSKPSTPANHHKETQTRSEPGQEFLSPSEDARPPGNPKPSHLQEEESSETEEERDITVKSDSSSDYQDKMIEESFPGLLKILQPASTLLAAGMCEPRFPREMMPDIYLVYGPSNRHLVPDDKGKTKI